MTDSGALRDELIRRRLAGGRRRPRSWMPRIDRDGPLPLSFDQQRMLFLNQLEPESPAYLVPLALRMRGRLDVAALGRAWDRLLERHEILRTRYRLAGGEPAQVIDAAPGGGLPLVEAGTADQTTQLAGELLGTPIDLGRAHPVRARLIQISADDHLLVLAIHHIACDDWSLNLLGEELAALYTATVTGTAPPLAPLTVQYADYAAWQRERLSGAALDKVLSYWRERLTGLRPLDLPTDRPRPAMRGWAGGRVPFSVHADLAEGLRELARTHGTTLFTVLLTAFQLLLARLSGQRDLAIGSAVNVRDHAELQRVIGFFLNTLVLRTGWDDDPSFRSALKQNRVAVAAALEHRDVPIHRLVRELEHDRDLSRTPLFQVMFDMMDTAPVTIDLPGVRVEQVELLGAVARFDLTMQVGEDPSGGLIGGLEYAAELFDRASAERIAGNFVRLLESVVERPDASLSQLDILTAGERGMLLDEWNRTEVSRPWIDVPAAVARQAQRQPNAVALVAGARRVSYRELDQRANRLAHHLRELGVGPEVVVGVCLDRGPELVVALLATWKAGAAYVPLDPEHPADRIGYQLADSGAAVVVAGADTTGVLAGVHAGPCVDVDRERDAIGRRPAEPPPVRVHPDDLAYVIYTSGTTGRPKGVLVNHRGLVNYLCWAAETYAGSSPYGAALFASVAFDLVVPNLYVPLMTGRPVHLLPPRFEADELASLLAASAPYAFVKLTPAHLDLLARGLTGDQASGLAETVAPAGDAFSGGLLDRWRRLSPARIINEYGPTEITVGNSAYVVAGPQQAEPLPIGRPIPNTTAYVLDPDLRPVPIGVVGEIYVGGVGVARGYRNQPAMTAERFVPDPYGRTPGARMYRTGDLGRVRPDGNFEFAGRVDDQAKIRGYRIEPAEIEAVLTTHSMVRDAVVVASQDRLVAYVAYVARAADPPGPTALRKYLAARLPSYMIPAVFVALDAFPLTANGKVDRRALPAPDGAAPHPERDYVAPRTVLEARMADAWRRALRVDRVGVHDSFFDLGGDSMRAVGLVGVLRDEGLDVTVRDLFQERTVARLAEFLAGRPASAEPADVVAPFALLDPGDAAALADGIVDAYPLSQVQAGMVFEMLSSADAPYHNGTSYHITDGRPFSLETLRAAAGIVVSRHEALRTSIDLSTYSVPLQLVHGQAEMSVGSRDLRHLTPSEQEREIHRYMAVERCRLFDLARPPLLRVFAHITSDDAWWISITECHPVIEGWGYHLMLMEMLTCYHELLDGRTPQLPQLPAVRFADFVAAELESLRSPEDRAYWQRVIAEALPLVLPSSWGGGPKEEHPVYDIEVPFHDLREPLLAMASRARVPLKSVLHAAHLKVMSMLTIEPSFSTGLVCDSRPEVLGADRVFGMYLNTVPFAFRRGASTWLDLARAVFAAEVELWPHRRYPVPAMQRELAGGSRINHVLFNYLDFNSVDTDLVDLHSGIDYSPNEFQLVVVAHRTGVVRLSAKPETVSRPFGRLLADMYRQVLEAMAADPAVPAGQPCLPAHEWERVVLRSNQTDVAWPEALTHELFEAQVRRAPDATAVIDPSGSAATYRELNERANRLAWHLRGLGVRTESFVGIYVEHSVEMLAGLLGILKAGGAYVPLDTTHPADRLGFMLSDTAAAIVVSTETLRGGLPRGQFRIVSLDGDAAEIAAAPHTDPEPSTTPDNLVYAMYTSGSTGRPKGVMISHRGLNNYLLWAVDGYGLAGAHGAPMLGSIAFDLSVPNFFLPLIGGRDVTLLPPDPSLSVLADLLCAPGDFSLLKITPAHLDMLRANLSRGVRIESVRTFVVGADEVKPETVAAWRKHAPQARIIDEYGPTETVVGCSVYTIPDDFDPSTPVPIGTPISNIRMYVLDHDLQPLPTGVVGELYIGGVGVARGYLNRPDLTAERFLPDPFAPHAGARFYRTGDLARFLPDGNLEFLGRIDHQVKIRGYRIELGEIEARLLLHPSVREAVVAARPDRHAGKRLIAYLVPDGAPPRAGELRRFLGQVLPEYMLPAVFVVLDALPLSRGGKVDRAALPEPKATRPDRDDGYLAPRTPTERVLADIWAEVLEVDRVGVRDNFLELGGHSLAALRLVGRVQAALGTRLSMASLLKAPTVATQARQLDGRQAADTPLVPIRSAGTGTPLVLVHAASGNVLNYADLARRLDRPVHALAARGLDSEFPPAERLEDMAADYLKAIAELGDRVVLGGWSMGGLVAYEMARQLHERTGRVAPLLLIDSYAPGADEDQVDLSDAGFLSWFAYDWGQGLGLDLGVDERELAALEPPARIGAVLARARTAGAAGPEIDAATLSRVVAVAKANVRAAISYRPPTGFPGPITVVAAADEPGTAADPAHGWHAWTTGQVRAITVPGNHYAVLRPPNIDAIAAAVDSTGRSRRQA